MRCAECNCENGGDECNWIKAAAARAAECPPRRMDELWEAAKNDPGDGSIIVGKPAPTQGETHE